MSGAGQGEDCSKADQHTPQPVAYLQWHSWAARMTVTHRQVRCRGCKLFAIWVPKAETTREWRRKVGRPRKVKASPAAPRGEGDENGD